MFKQEIKRRRY